MSVDGFDVEAVYEAAVQAVEHARSGKGPVLLVTEAYRFEGHYAGEPEVYRSREEVRAFRQQDPLQYFSKTLQNRGQASEAELQSIDKEVEQEIAAAVEFAKHSPQPDPGTAMDYIYA
jgi:pyruvate dehydrogenase E1 component alpha subunit